MSISAFDTPSILLNENLTIILRNFFRSSNNETILFYIINDILQEASRNIF